jgi:hypothetical protein
METEQPPQPVEAEPVGGDDAEATAEVAPAKNVFQETTVRCVLCVAPRMRRLRRGSQDL